ncbi:MAG: aspartate carbamoyltransferase catalytic subunit [Phycisphaeraceae bacterium]|nr:MAG: aspartate carbamoyltransferase catalytic subunit [Phycisphaeraceae bacterium]
MPDATRHLLQLEGMSPATMRALLVRAQAFMQPGEKGKPLAGKTVATVFFEDSTRTRTSFVLAAKRLGAEAVDLSGSGTSLSKGETLDDTARTIEAMGVDAIVVRVKQAGGPHLIARAVKCSVLNAGDGKHEHPTQGLLDVLAMARAKGRAETFDLTGLTVAIVGDVNASRVARSDVIAMTALGAEVVLVGPPAQAPRSLGALGAKVERDLDAVLGRADAVQMLRVQFERHGGKGIASRREYRAGYALTTARAKRMRPDAVVMHPGPMNRGMEIDDAVADGDGIELPRSIVLDQVSCGVAVRMAVLERLLVGGPGDGPGDGLE